MRATPAENRRCRCPATGARVARLALWAALSWTCAWAQASTVVVFTPRTGGAYGELVEAFRQEVASAPGVRVQVVPVPDPASKAALPEDTLIVLSVGVAAMTQAAASDIRAPVLSVLVPRASYESIANSAPAARRGAAIFIDQPLERQLDLVRAVMPSAQRLGLVTGELAPQETQAFRAQAARRGLELVAERVSRESELYGALQTVMRSSDVFIALPDPAIVNVSTAQNLLLTSFRFRIPVIGYSASYVRAGALAAVFSTPRQAGVEAGQVVRSFIRTGTLPAPRYPRQFSVSVNRPVADSLGLSVPDEGVLLQRLQQAEKAQ